MSLYNASLKESDTLLLDIVMLCKMKWKKLMERNVCSGGRGEAVPARTSPVQRPPTPSIFEELNNNAHRNCCVWVKGLNSGPVLYEFSKWRSENRSEKKLCHDVPHQTNILNSSHLTENWLKTVCIDLKYRNIAMTLLHTHAHTHTLLTQYVTMPGYFGLFLKRFINSWCYKNIVCYFCIFIIIYWKCTTYALMLKQ